jgi:hypothetical protein
MYCDVEVEFVPYKYYKHRHGITGIYRNDAVGNLPAASLLAYQFERVFMQIRVWQIQNGAQESS